MQYSDSEPALHDLLFHFDDSLDLTLGAASDMTPSFFIAMVRGAYKSVLCFNVMSNLLWACARFLAVYRSVNQFVSLSRTLVDEDHY